MKVTTRAVIAALAFALAGCQAPAPQAGAGAGAPPAGAAGAQAAAGAGQRAGGFTGGNFAGGQRTGGRSVVVPVQTAVATFGALTADNTAAGAVSPETQSSVAAGATGTVRALVRKPGDWVKQGDVVLQLDDTQLKLSYQLAETALKNAVVNAGFDANGRPSDTSKISLQIQSAQADLAQKQKILAADQELFKIGGVTQTTLDNDAIAIQTSAANLESLRASVQQSSLTVQTASLQLQQAQLNLSNAAIKAPFDGQIASIGVHLGEYVGTSTAVFVLVSQHKILTFSVPPSDAPGLTQGTRVKYTYGGSEYVATVAQLPAAPVGGLVPLTANLPDTLSPPLGTVGTITYSVQLAQGTLVPLQAVQSAENTTFVFTVGQGNKVGKTLVGILSETGSYAALTGVKPGDTVIVNPPPGLLVGSTVAPQAATGLVAAPAQKVQAPAQTRQAGAVPGQAGTAPPRGGSAEGQRTPGDAGQAGAFTGQRRQRPQTGTDPAVTAAPAPAPSTTTGGQ